MMTKFIFIVSILVSCITFCSCSENCEDRIPKTACNYCQGENLNIDQLSRFSDIYYINDIISPGNSYRWLWRSYNDTIEVGGGMREIGRPDYNMQLFFKKNKKCLTYLYALKVEFDDNIVFDMDGNIISGGFSFKKRNNYNFRLQKYIENQILIGDVNNMKFWLEFIEDTHQIAQFGYEPFYHN